MHGPKRFKHTLLYCTLTCQIAFRLTEAQENVSSCIDLGFNGPDCSDCDRIADYIKDEGLVGECHGCCSRTQVTSGSKFRSGVLEVCKHRLREFPHVETFVRERSESYPSIKVKYYFGAPPRLNFKSGSSSESIRIDHWKTENIEEYLKDKLLPAT
ncbi:hypothetical protein WJX77_004426 [Trebouxia sp. C0004]